MKLTEEQMETISNQASFRMKKKMLTENELTKGWSTEAINRLAFDLARLNEKTKFDKFMESLISI